MAITINGSTGIQMAADDSLGFGDIGLSQDTLFSGRKNVIINGDFDVWQRGTSGSHATAVWSYDSADRWNTYISTASTITLSQQAFALGQTDVPNEPTYFARFNWLGTAQSETKEFGQNIEGVRTFAGQNCTLSFYAKATTGVSGNVYLGQIFGSGGSPAVYKTQPITLTTSWQRYEFTFTLDSISGKTIGSTANYLQVNFQFTGTAGNNFDIAQVQLEKGSQATAFEKRSYGEELAACQRYYWQWNGTAANEVVAVGMRYINGTAYSCIHFPVQMRAIPTLTAPASFNELYSTSATTVIPGAGTSTKDSLTLTWASLASGGEASVLRANSTASYLKADAEL